jgi:hypothetical protein
MLALLIVAQLSPPIPPHFKAPEGSCMPAHLQGLTGNRGRRIAMPPTKPCPPLRDMVPFKNQGVPDPYPVDARRLG